jgi:hypothetical protein
MPSEKREVLPAVAVQDDEDEEEEEAYTDRYSHVGWEEMINDSTSYGF